MPMNILIEKLILGAPTVPDALVQATVDRTHEGAPSSWGAALRNRWDVSLDVLAALVERADPLGYEPYMPRLIDATISSGKDPLPLLDGLRKTLLKPVVEGMRSLPTYPQFRAAALDRGSPALMGALTWGTTCRPASLRGRHGDFWTGSFVTSVTTQP